MKQLTLILMILLISGCTSRKQEYLVIQNWFGGKNIKVLLNSELIDTQIQNIYLNSRNIKSLSLNRRMDSIFIEQRKPNSKLLCMRDIKLDSISIQGIDQIIINNRRIDRDQFKKITIEESAVKSIEIIRSNDLHVGNQNNGVLVIKTK